MIGNKRVIAGVVARMKSQRLKRKALEDIGGRAMTQLILERLQRSQLIDEVVVCTSSHPEDQVLIDKAREEWNVPAFAGHEEDVMLRLIQMGERHEADYVIRATGDNPLIDTGYLDDSIRLHFAQDAEYTRTEGLPLGLAAEVMNLETLRRCHNMIVGPKHSYIQLYLFNPEVFHCEVLNARPQVARPYYWLSVDTDRDITLVRKIVNRCGPFSKVDQIVPYCDTIEGECAIDPTFPVKLPDGQSMEYHSYLAMMGERVRVMNEQRGHPS